MNKNRANQGQIQSRAVPFYRERTPNSKPRFSYLILPRVDAVVNELVGDREVCVSVSSLVAANERVIEGRDSVVKVE